MVNPQIAAYDDAIRHFGSALESDLQRVASYGVHHSQFDSLKVGESHRALGEMSVKFPDLRTTQRLGQVVENLAALVGEVEDFISGRMRFDAPPIRPGIGAHMLQSRLTDGVAGPKSFGYFTGGESFRFGAVSGFAQSRPVDEVGGDVYAVATVGSCTRLLFADAMGHGLPAAIVAARLLGMFDLGSAMGMDPVCLVSQLDERLGAVGLDRGGLATAFVGDLNVTTGNLLYCSAGQAPLLHVDGKNERCHWLAATCPPLGTLTAKEMAISEQLTLGAGDGFVMASDGIFECRNSAGKEFGRKRVCQLVRQRWHARPNDLARSVVLNLLSDSSSFSGTGPAQDDQTAFCLVRPEETNPRLG